MLTVKELINKLKEFPEDTPVWIECLMDDTYSGPLDLNEMQIDKAVYIKKHEIIDQLRRSRTKVVGDYWTSWDSMFEDEHAEEPREFLFIHTPS